MGRDRSLAKVGRKIGKKSVLRIIEQWSSKFSWQQRVTEYDSAVSRELLAAEQRALETEAEFWAKEIVFHRRRAYENGMKLIRKADEVLASLSKGTLGDAVRAMQVGDTLIRLGLGVATDTHRTEISGPDSTPLAIAPSCVVVLEPNDGEPE